MTAARRVEDLYEFLNVADVVARHGLSEHAAAVHVTRAAIRWDRAVGDARRVSAVGWAKYTARFKRPLPEVLPEPSWDDRPVRPGHVVYFLRAAGSPLIKIGKASDLARRLDGFALHNPLPVEVLAVTRGDHRLERALHGRFAAARVHHEWFEPTPELLQLIDSLPRRVGAVR